jgi:hypothetical protein
MNVSTGFLLVCTLLYAWKHKGSDALGISLGLAVGVNGAGGWIGQIVTELTNVAINVVTTLIHALPFG